MTEWLRRAMHLPELASIHEQFLVLSQIARERFGDSLGGKLLLRSKLSADGIAAVVAASVGGAGSLCVDAEADRLREGLRGGFIDFVVGSLDEALRILKNEIRRARPISVGLTTDPDSCIEAMIERGLQPDFLSAVPDRLVKIFHQRGAVFLPREGSHEPGTSLLAWSVDDDVARTMRRIAEMASASLDSACIDTAARRRWLEQSPRYLGRGFAQHQCLRVNAAELAQILPRVRDRFPTARMTCEGQPA